MRLDACIQQMPQLVAKDSVLLDLEHHVSLLKRVFCPPHGLRAYATKGTWIPIGPSGF
jgi:hypothetical protein